MADFSNPDKFKEEVVSKGIAKRKYLLVDNELEGLEFELKENPLNKSYAPMKLFKLSEVESLATTKWGSMEKLETEQEKRRQQNSKLEKRKEEEKRRFWDCKELFDPLKRFMVNIELPTERVSSYFKNKDDNRQMASGSPGNLLECDVILCFCDCLHSIPNDFVARRIFKRFPEARQVDKETPYNERRKMGHFSWTFSLTSDQVVINLYVVHKWKGVSQTKASSVINFEALAIGLQRLSALLSKTLANDGRQSNSLNIGTYVPYKVDSETFKRTLQDNMEQPVTIFTNTNTTTS